MKYKIILLIIILPLFVNAQSGDDGWNNRILTQYGENEERARVSITLKRVSVPITMITSEPT